MAWCPQATSHCLSQCWPISMLPYGIIRPQWDKWDQPYMMCSQVLLVACYLKKITKLFLKCHVEVQYLFAICSVTYDIVCEAQCLWCICSPNAIIIVSSTTCFVVLRFCLQACKIFMAFIEPMHRNKPNITYLLAKSSCFSWNVIVYVM